MADAYSVCARWVDINTNSPDARPMKCRNVWFSGATIYSYGTHFPLARAIKEEGRTVLWLLNGDASTVTTTRHQSHIRSAVGGSSIPSVIVPFSVLDAAGIEVGSVRLLEALPQRTEVIPHVAYVRPESAVWVSVAQSAYVALTEEELAARVEHLDRKARESWEERKGWADGSSSGYWLDWLVDHPAPRTHTVEDIPAHQRKEWRVVGHEDVLYLDRHQRTRIDVEALPEGGCRYTWETTRHWLGESLIEATVIDRRNFTCRGCRGSGLHPDAPPRPARPDWHTDEYVLTDEGRMARMRLWHQACAEWDAAWAAFSGKRCPRCNGRARWTKRFDRRRKFLSGFDRGESRASYFFCELPVTDAATVEEALEALKPSTVRLAEQMGREVRRQGDIFAVALSPDITRRRLTAMGARFVKRGTLLGTNHEATEVALLPDGTTVARGCLYHAPGSWRRPDHARVSLGSGFHVIVKNTVPLAA